jgi:hypothetical protein
MLECTLLQRALSHTEQEARPQLRAQRVVQLGIRTRRELRPYAETFKGLELSTIRVTHARWRWGHATCAPAPPTQLPTQTVRRFETPHAFRPPPDRQIVMRTSTVRIRWSAKLRRMIPSFVGTPMSQTTPVCALKASPVLLCMHKLMTGCAENTTGNYLPLFESNNPVIREKI